MTCGTSPEQPFRGVNELLLTTAASRAAERYLILQGGVEYRQSFVVISALTGLVVSARGGGSSEGVITRGCLLIIAVLPCCSSAYARPDSQPRKPANAI